MVEWRERRMSVEQRRLAAVIFTDVAGCTALLEKNEALALQALDKQQSSGNDWNKEGKRSRRWKLNER